jgi:hypothetical protein
MLPKIAVIGLMLLATAACAPMPRPAPSIPPAAGPEANAASADAKSADAGKPGDLLEPDMQAMPPTDVRTMKCSVINSAGDDDKAYASTFLLGYRSALMHMHVIDTKRIDSILQAAVAECATKPDAFAYKVFAEAEVKVYAADRAAPKLLHHKKLATTPAAESPGTPAPAAPAAERGPSAEPPPMRYAPAESAPPPAEPVPAPASGDTPSTSSPSEGSPK